MDFGGVIDSIAEAFTRAQQNGSFYSILIGWIVGIGLTQWIKMWPVFPSRKWAIRALAVPVAAAVTFSLWPEKVFDAMRVCTALAAGVSAPWMYQLMTGLLYKFWPGLEKHLSAQPPAEL